MSRTMIVANLRYIDPRPKGKGHGSKGLRNMLGYFQYRNDRDDYIPAGRQERWKDMGLGLYYKEILKNCSKLQSPEVLAWSYVISPEPDLMTLIPEKDRHPFIQSLTENIIERYYAERGCTAPYSYVVHEAQTQDGRPHTHTHVILPGMAQDELEGWQPFKNYRSRGHLALLDEIANDELIQGLNLKFGLDWRHQLELGVPVTDLRL